MNNRNAIKYRPFAAVEGHAEAIEALHKKVDLVEKPIPSEDDIERINRLLVEAVHTKKEVKITLFNAGTILDKYAVIESFNNNNKTLLLSDNTKIKIDDIINVE